MSGVTRHLRVGIVTVLLVVLSFIPLQASAGQAGQELSGIQLADKELIITEFQTNGGTASQEFIELHNMTETDLVLGDGKFTGDLWRLQFFGSSIITKDGQLAWPTNPTSSVSLKGIVPANGYLVFSTTGYSPNNIEIAPEQHFGTVSSNFMTDSGGGLRLTRTTAAATPVVSVEDQLAWQDPAKFPANGILPTPGKGKSLQRIPYDDDRYLDTDGVVAAFGSEADISPLEAWNAPIVEVPEETSPDNPGEPVEQAPVGPSPEIPAGPPANAGLTAPFLTELLPNPAAPLKDETDEYIELYNPNASSFNLKGYSLQVGISTIKEFSFTEDVLLAPESYRAFLPTETKLSLTVGSSRVDLQACKLEYSIVSPK